MTLPRRLSFSVFAVAALFGSLAGCSQSDTAKSEKILLILKTADNPFFREIERGVRAELRNHNVSDDTLIVRAGRNEGDVSSQRRILEEFYRQELAPGRKGIRALLLTPSGSEDELTSVLKLYEDAGVSLILIDTAISKEALSRAGITRSSFVGSDNVQGGVLAAELIASRLPTGGSVLLLNGAPGHETADARKSGFKKGIESARAAGIPFEITERTANWRRSEARSIADSMFAMGRTFSAVFAANDEMALGVAEAVRQSRRRESNPIIIGFDAIDEARTAVQYGLLTATIAQQPEQMGRRAVRKVVASAVSASHQVIPVEAVVK